MGVGVGDVVFLSVRPEDAGEILHPYVVLAVDRTGGDEEAVLEACMISTNMKKAYWPGNIALEDGEAGLPRRSIVVVSRTAVVPESRVLSLVGKMGRERLGEIRRGIEAINHLVGRRRPREAGQANDE